MLPPIAAFPFQPGASWYMQLDGGATAANPPAATSLTLEGAPDTLPPPQRPSSAMGMAHAPAADAAAPSQQQQLGRAAAPPLPHPPAAAAPIGGSGARTPAAGAGGASRAASPERAAAREAARRHGAPEFASVEAVTEAVEERTSLLTRIFQQKLHQQSAALLALRESESKAHAKEIADLKAAFGARLGEAVDKVRAVHATNRDAVDILAANKRLKAEVARLKHDAEKAYEAQKEAEERERLKGEEGAAVVQQLMTQLQEKESLLAAGAGAMSPEEREAMLEKERVRAQQAAEKEKARVEAAMAEERAKAADRLAELERSTAEANERGAAAVAERAKAAADLDQERKAHTATREKLAELERKWEAMGAQREKLAELDATTAKATEQIVTSLGHMKQFCNATNEHLMVDTNCISCLDPLDEPHVLVPCGHSLCVRCTRALDKNARQTEMGPIKVCPICAEQTPAYTLDVDDMPNVEAFPNIMLDALLTRLSSKRINVQSLLTTVLDIFDQPGGRGLPAKAAQLRPPPSPSSKSASPSPPKARK